MRYKVGDKVLIKSLDWYNENRDKIGQVDCGGICFVPPMVSFCGQIVTISFILPTLEVYHIKEDGGAFNWTDEMIEGIFAGETKPLVFGDSWECPQGYEFVDENGNVINATKIVLTKKKSKYPKTYEECCKVLGPDTMDNGAQVYKWESIIRFQELLIARDAYWKIAGEEMGLGKPWKPGWENSEERRYSIVNIEGDINLPETTLTKWVLKVTNKILVFPTEEMRDAFYENFKDLIEICKELI